MSGFERRRSFDLFGSTIELLIGPPSRAGVPPTEIAAVEIEALLRDMHRKLTRFDGGSELCKLNADPAAECSVSPMLALALRAGLWAAEETDGLVDPTLVDDLERSGYSRSLVGVEAAPLADALAAAPPRRAAQASVAARWREFEVDQAHGRIRRPPGVRFDTGGTGKGLAADLAAARLSDHFTYSVNVGGDLRVGGASPRPRVVQVESPFSGETLFGFEMTEGAVATSGLATRIWRTDHGFAHHLLDPSTGLPAWTGVTQATAIAPTALAAETLAKLALLSGPERGRSLLAENGGALVLDDGSVERLGRLRSERRQAA